MMKSFYFKVIFYVIVKVIKYLVQEVMVGMPVLVVEMSQNALVVT